jgi:hypothetical protein
VPRHPVNQSVNQSVVHPPRSQIPPEACPKQDQPRKGSSPDHEGAGVLTTVLLITLPALSWPSFTPLSSLPPLGLELPSLLNPPIFFFFSASVDSPGWSSFEGLAGLKCRYCSQACRLAAHRATSGQQTRIAVNGPCQWLSGSPPPSARGHGVRFSIPAMEANGRLWGGWPALADHWLGGRLWVDDTNELNRLWTREAATKTACWQFLIQSSL